MIDPEKTRMWLFTIEDNQEIVPDYAEIFHETLDELEACRKELEHWKDHYDFLLERVANGRRNVITDWMGYPR